MIKWLMKTKRIIFLVYSTARKLIHEKKQSSPTKRIKIIPIGKLSMPSACISFKRKMTRLSKTINLRDDVFISFNKETLL